MASKKIKGITIQYEGDTTKLETALSSVEKKGRNARAEMSEVNRALKEAPDSAVLWQQKQELLNKSLESSKEKLKLLEDAQEQVTRQFEKGDIGEEQYRAFERELERARADTEKLGDEIADTKKNINDLGGEAGKTSGNLDKMGDSAESTSKGFTVLKGAVAQLAADGFEKLISSLKDASKQALEYEDSIAKVSTIADEAIPVEKISSDIIKLSNESGVAASIIANTTYDAISAGQKTADAVEFVGDATKLARAGFAETGATLDLLTTILNAYHLEASETARVSDVLIQTQNLGKTSVGQLASAMGKIIPTANAYKVELEQLAAGYATMTSNGVATSESTTYMNSMLNELGKSGTKASDILKNETGKSFKELMEEGKTLADVLSVIKDSADKSNLSFGDMWGSAEAGKAGLILLGDSAENYNETLRQMQSSAGATEKAFDKLETKQYKLEKAQNQLKNAAISLGSTTLEMLVPLAEKALPFIEKKLIAFNDNLPEIKETISDMLPLIKGVGAAYASWKIASTAVKGAEAVKGLATAVKGAEGATSLLNKTMLANPAVAVTAAVVGLTVALAALYKAEKDELDIEGRIAKQYDNEYKAIQDTRDEINKLKDGFNSRAMDIENEAKRTEELWKELDSLADASGRVKDADKKRAEYILGELNSALGTEYSMTDNQIEGYKNLAAEIDNVIAKKKAEALLDQYMAMNSAVLAQNASAQQRYEQYSIAYEEAVEAEAQAKRKYEATTQDKYISAQEGLKALEAYEEAKEHTKNTADLMQQARADFNSSLDYIHKLDDAERAFSEERYNDVKDILFSEKDANKEILNDTKNSLEKRQKAYDDSLKKIYADMRLYSQNWRQAEADAIMKEMGEVVEAGKIANIDADEAFTKEFKDSVQKMLDKGFDISELAKWAKDSGVDVGEVFGDDYTKIVQDQLDKGYNIADLLQWGANSGQNIGALFTNEFTLKFQSQLDSGFNIEGLISWAQEKGYELGDVFGANFSSRYNQYLYDANDLVNRYSINSESDARGWREYFNAHKNDPNDEAVNYFKSIGWHASGGFIGIGHEGIVAEAGPELLQVMNGGVKVTPLSRSTTNTPVGAGGDTINNYYYNSVYATVGSRYDVYKVAEDLDTAERRINQGKGRQ